MTNTWGNILLPLLSHLTSSQAFANWVNRYARAAAELVFIQIIRDVYVFRESSSPHLLVSVRWGWCLSAPCHGFPGSASRGGTSYRVERPARCAGGQPRFPAPRQTHQLWSSLTRLVELGTDPLLRLHFNLSTSAKTSIFTFSVFENN